VRQFQLERDLIDEHENDSSSGSNERIIGRSEDRK